MANSGRRRRGRATRGSALLMVVAIGAAATSCGLVASSDAPTGWPMIDESAPLLSATCDIPGLTVRPPHEGSWAPEPTELDGLSVLASTEGTDLLLHTAGGPAPFVAGVNLGPTIPGFQPGEVAIRREDFRRWFPMMAELGNRAIRIYSIQPPAFYEELRAYNLDHPDAPLYLIHGAWIPEERFISERDLFAPGLQQEFFAEISDAVDVVFGDAVLPERLGHAEGTYTADVSPWTYAWILGVEWDPPATLDSDEANVGRAPYVGTHFSTTEDASPTEIWIAGAVDHAAREMAARGVAVPIGFANWPTTDPLDHPDEPLENEDLVAVDANHVVPTSWPAGTFASYHAYSYYPDFQRYEAGIVDCNYRGRPDNYAGYLAKLRRHHADIPVMITEFGVPSSTGNAHYGPQGRDQGGHSEQEAMLINAEMMATIHDLGFAGGYVFQWADEWFKFTWNTIDYELPPDRRQLWMNTWTNEAHFGVIAIEPGQTRAVTIDGERDEWADNGSQVIHESRGSIREVRALKDEGYIYLGITLDEADAIDDRPLTIGFDVLPAEGGGLPDTGSLSPGSDYAAVLGGGSDGQIWVAGHADVYRRTYGVLRGFIDVDPADVAPGSGSWAPHQLITNRPLVIPTTGESFGVEVFNAGLLFRGSSDPLEDDFDSRTAWQAEDDFVEIRLPHFAIGMSDPSQRLAFTVDHLGITSPVPFDRLGVDLFFDGVLFETSGYAWEPWQLPQWHERPKAGSVDYLATTNRRLMGDADPLGS